MTDRELMQQALDALEQSNTKAPFGADGVVYWEGVKTHEAAIDALRKRLAQPEQEPVAWLNEEKKIIYWHNTHETDDYHGFKRTTPLYTTPPQRKPLTDEEIADEWERVTGHNISHGDRQECRAMYISPDEVAEFARAIIAKVTGEKE